MAAIPPHIAAGFDSDSEGVLLTLTVASSFGAGLAFASAHALTRDALIQVVRTTRMAWLRMARGFAVASPASIFAGFAGRGHLRARAPDIRIR